MADLRPDLDAALAAFGVTATVTPSGGAPVSTTVIDCGRPPAPAIGSIHMAPAAAVELRKVLAIATADVPALPVGSTVEAALDHRGLRSWRVDRVDDTRPDEFRAVVS